MNDYENKILLNNIENIKKNILELTSNLYEFNITLENNLEINNHAYKQDLIDKISNDLEYIQNSINDEIIPKLKANLDNWLGD